MEENIRQQKRHAGREFVHRAAALLFLALVVLAVRFGMVGREKKNHSHSGQALGTFYSVKLANTPMSRTRWSAIQKGIEAELDRIEELFSIYRPESEIQRFNRVRSPNEGFRASPEFRALLETAIELSRETGGYFDPTVGALVELWGFGPEREPAKPDPKAVQEARSRTGTERIRFDEQGRVRKTHARLALNLGAVAKGYAVDRVSRFLVNRGVKNYIVEIGGEVYARGTRNGHPWKVGIDTPDSMLLPGEKIYRVIPLRDRAVATSGDYRQFYDNGGRRVTHLIDPRSGYPIDHALASVSVTASNTVSADAYATALFIMGAEKGMRWVESKPGVEALFIERTEEGFTGRASSAFGGREYGRRDLATNGHK